MRISARYSSFGVYETAILGILSQSTGWATAARRVVEAAAPIPVIGFGARHVHPSVADQMDYASVVGGCVGASTPAGARLAGLAPTGTMPHALIIIFGDTVRAAEAFDRHIDPDVPRIVLVDTFKDEAEEALRVANALGDRLWGVRLDTPSERGRVTADLVKEVRARLDQAGHPASRSSSRAGSISSGSPTSRSRELPSTRSRWVRRSPMPRQSTSPATSRRSMAGLSPSAAASRGAPRTRDCSGSTCPPERADGRRRAGVGVRAVHPRIESPHAAAPAAAALLLSDAWCSSRAKPRSSRPLAARTTTWVTIPVPRIASGRSSTLIPGPLCALRAWPGSRADG